MRRFFNFIRNILAAVGLLAIIISAGGLYLVVRSTSLPPRALAQKLLEKTGLQSTVMADWLEQSARDKRVVLPPLNSPGWSGHGAQPGKKLKPVSYDAEGHPVAEPRPGIQEDYPEQEAGRLIQVASSAEFLGAINRAEPGDVITLSPGTYKLNERTISIIRPGSAGKPITVRADTFGDVILELITLEGFLVKAPFWIFENLEIKGLCRNHNYCEHAFHVVGRGQGFVLRNCRLHDFNSIVKANGVVNKDGARIFPDGALIEGNTFYNSEIRKTGHPVNGIDVVGPNNWIVRNNIIADFAKGRGNRISYAAFIKGNSSTGVFENNLVIGEYRHSGGTRVGLSFGGGGSGPKFCRNGNNTVEHTGGIVRNNVVMNFTDVGLYLNRARDTLVLNNIFYRTLGIDVRFAESTAVIENNILAGKIRARDGGTFSQRSNRIIDSSGGWFGADFDDWFASPVKADFTLLAAEGIVDKGNRHEELREDFCGEKRVGKPDLGAFEYNNSQSTCTLLDFSTIQ